MSDPTENDAECRTFEPLDACAISRRDFLRRAAGVGTGLAGLSLLQPVSGTASILAAATSPPAATAFPAGFGAYFWGGYQAPGAISSLAPGLMKIQEAGFAATARLLLTPRLRNPGTDNFYNFDLNQWEQECPKSGPFLGPAVRSSFYREALSLPGIQTFVLTTYDSVCAGVLGYEGGFYQPSFLSHAATADAVRSQYQDLTLALYETQQGSGKRFIISNWETDNHIYWVTAYAYVTDPVKRAQCDATLPHPADRIEGFVRWFQLRQEGIRAGQAMAARRGLGGVEVNDAIEFASYRLLKSQGYASAFFDVIPRVRPDVATYSAWDTANTGLLDEDLPAIKQQLDGIGTQLILGEFGQSYMSQQPGSPIAWRTVKSARAAVRAQIPIVTLWEAFNVTGLADGLLNPDGSPQQIVADLRAGLQNYPDPPSQAGSPPVAIQAINDRGVISGLHYLELHGTFPGASPQPGQGYAILVDAEGQPIAAAVTYESTGQINISFAPQPAGRWCVFRARRRSDQALSPEFGPRPLGP